MTTKRTTLRRSHPPGGASPAPFYASGSEALAMLGEPVMVLDQEWRFAEVNAKAAEGLGRPRQALIGQVIWSEFPDWVDGPLYRACQQAAQDRQPTVVEVYAPHSRRWLEHRVYPSGAGLLILTLDITKSKRQDAAALERAGAFANALLDSLPGVVYLYGEDLKFLRWNKKFEQVTGYSGAEIAAMQPLDFFTGADKTLIAERIGGVFATGSGEAEAEFVAKDGRRTPYYFTGLRTEIDGRTCLIGVGIDVTQRRAAEAALRESEERYRLITDVVSDYVFSTRVEPDGAMRLNWTAGAFETITGYSLDEYRARGGWRAALHPADREVDARDFEQLRHNHSLVSTVRTIRKDGRLAWSQVYAHPVWEAATQRLVGIYGAVQDVTEREVARQELVAREKQLALIFDTVRDALFLLTVEPDETYRFVSVNPVFLAVTGMQREQVVGKRMEEVLPASAHALARDKYRQAIQQNQTVSWEEASAYPSGTLYGAVAVTPAQDAAGVVTHLIGSVHDVTEIRRAQEEISQLNRVLEQRVAERTAQLVVANKDLEAFSYSVSHDLRAPLRAISGFAQIIARRHRAALNEEGQHYFDNIVQASERMGLLIDDLLQYSRLGRQAVTLTPVSLNSLLGGLARDFGPRLAEMGGTLEIAPDLPAVLGDRTLLRQIFTNLLDNALTYRRPQAPARVAVTWRAEGQAVVVRVQDNGIGIPAEHHQKIFNVFQRLHSDDEYPGTGIGLATVRKAAEMVDAQVWVESEAGQGSSFFVALRRG